MPRIVKILTMGEISTNCYLVQIDDSNELIVIDPAESAPVSAFCKENDWSIKYILFTHGHYDHLTGADELHAESGAGLAAGIHEKEILADPELNFSVYLAKPIAIEINHFLEDGTSFCGLSVHHTPGHTPGGICLTGPGFVISGDTIFAESIGRTDLPGGDYKALIRSIRKKLFVLPDMTLVYPGHGPQTTIQHEKNHNPFLVGVKDN